MPLLQDLPDQDTFTSILDRIVGTGEGGTGVAGALGLLESLDPAQLTGSVTARLNGQVSATVSVDGSAVVGGAADRLRAITTTLPSDSGELIAPLTGPLGRLGALSGPELSGLVASMVSALQQLRSAAPADRLALFDEARDGLLALRGELVGGPFGELREWSELVGGLVEQLAPVLAGGTGSVQDRIVAFLAEKVAELLRSLLAGQQGPAAGVTSALETALPTDAVPAIQTLVTRLIGEMDAVRVQFENGDLTGTTGLQAASETMAQLVARLGAVRGGLNGALALEGSTAAGLTRVLDERLAEVAAAEVVDVGDVRAAFVQAIASVESAVRELRLQRVQQTLDEMFGRFQALVGQADLGQLMPRIAALEAEARSATERLDAEIFTVLATIRDQFTRLRDGLNDAASALGTFQPDGSFRFDLQAELEAFLEGIRTNLTDTVQPLLADFQATVTGTLDQVTAVLTTTQAELATVRAELEASLQGVADQLEAADVAAELEGIAARIDEVLNQLGQIDFEVVVEPVVAELDGMAAKLQEIDVASLNEIAVGALKVSVEVVVHLDFSTQITDALMQEIDAVLAVPRDALAQLEESVESALRRVAQLSPDALLHPLLSVFDPVREQLEALRVEKLLEPLDAWHDLLLAELDRVTPGALLQPVVELHDELAAAVASLTPGSLAAPLQEAIDTLGSQLPTLDLAGVRAQLTSAVDAVEGVMDAIDPASLLDPLVTPFEKIEASMAGFRPGDLLAPVTAFFDAITEPLEGLTPQHVALIQTALAPLAELPAALDPRVVFPAIRGGYGVTLSRLDAIRVGRILADLQRPFAEMRAAFTLAGGSDTGVTLAIEALNPLQHEQLSGLAAGLEQARERIRSAFPEGPPPAALVARYEEVSPKLSRLSPAWLSADLTPAAIRAAVRQANPLNVAGELDAAWDAVREQVGALSPRRIQENLQESYDAVRAVVSSLDPAPLVDALEAVVADLLDTLDAIDLDLLVVELEALVDQVQAIVAALDPRTVIEELDALVGEVVALAATLRPSTLLAGLDAPLEAARDVLELFDPAALVEPLGDLFAAIQDVLARIDLGIVLRPLLERLEALRSELEDALRRTEEAFNRMLRAIPV